MNLSQNLVGIAVGLPSVSGEKSFSYRAFRTTKVLNSLLLSELSYLDHVVKTNATEIAQP